jgi:hypothetical protein
MTQWKTGLFECNSESCLVTWLLPCHVYAKLNLTHYGCNFILYGLFVLGIRNLYAWMMYLNQNTCPSNHVTQCWGLNEHCGNSYMNIDNRHYQCVYRPDFSTCTYDTINCFHDISPLYVGGMICLGMIYIGIFFLNYVARKNIKELKEIDTSDNICVHTICSPCSLAQAYREIV